MPSAGDVRFECAYCHLVLAIDGTAEFDAGALFRCPFCDCHSARSTTGVGREASTTPVDVLRASRVAERPGPGGRVQLRRAPLPCSAYDVSRDQARDRA